ncbi:MAG: Fe-S cluster assembly protein SufD [Robiginitomaculum sp.]|nr:Fe-S cluster assembly protein SufD [Robiginitomaculum sp.]
MTSINSAETALGKMLAAQDRSGEQMARFEQFLKVGLPHPRAENWRWTDLHGAIAKFTKLAVTTGSDAHVTLSGAAQIDFTSAKEDPISLLAAGLSTDNSIAGFVIDQTSDDIMTLHTSSNASFSGSVVQVLVRAGCSVVIVEDNQQDDSGFSVNAREFIVEDGASLTRILINENSLDQTRINQAFVEIGESASFNQYTFDFGAYLSRNETNVSLVGKNTKVNINGAYLLANNDKVDMSSIIDHQHQNCVTKQLVKGVVMGNAKAVFQGKFHVRRAAQKTDAKMGHHTILLGDTARVQAKPELEIYADDVACAHGNTIGELDENALFYMRQRGLSESQARALLIRAFVIETLDGLPANIAEDLTTGIDNWLEQRQ